MGMGGIQDVNEMGCGEATPPAKEGKGQGCVEAVESGNSSPWEGGTVAMGRGWGGVRGRLGASGVVLRGLERTQRTGKSDHRMWENKFPEGHTAGLWGRGESVCSL